MAYDPGSYQDRVDTWVEEQQYLANPYPIAPEAAIPATMSEAAADPAGTGLATDFDRDKRMEAAQAAVHFAQTAEAFAAAVDSKDDAEARKLRKDHAKAQINLKKLVMELSDLDDLDGAENENASAADFPSLDPDQLQNDEANVPNPFTDVHETNYNVENLFGLEVWYHCPSKTFLYMRKGYLQPLDQEFYNRHQTRLDLLRVGVIKPGYKTDHINGYQVKYHRDWGTFSRDNGDGKESITSEFALEHEEEMNALANLSKPQESSSKRRREVVTVERNGRSPKRVARSVYEDSDMSLLDESSTSESQSAD